jgi:molybdopterin molybdotransferase
MISVEEALEAVLRQARVLPAVEASAGAALGRTLAEDVASDVDSPPWDKALVDGYAVRAADVASGDAVLSVLEEVTAGKTPTREVSASHCTRIMTGAPLPSGADAVVLVERTEMLSDHRVRIRTTAKPGQNVLQRAASMQRGQAVLRRGQTIRAIEMGVLAEVGRTHVHVVRPARVAILVTGDELVSAQHAPTGAHIRNSNGPMLAALITEAGAEAIPLGIARDDEDDLREKIERGLEADVLVISGGVSAGVVDLVPKSLVASGVQQVFHHVNLKPGKPLWFGATARALAFGLPGNPVSTLVCFGLFVKPALARLQGQAVHAAGRLATLAHDFEQRDARPTYFPAVQSFDGDQTTVAPLPWRGSADLHALVAANCLAFFPGGEQVYRAGERVAVFPL